MFLPLTTSERLERRPVLVVLLVAVCTAVFGVTFSAKTLGSLVVTAFAFKSLAGGPGLVTYTFLHADVSHLAGNMFFLWTFGRLVEARWGHVLTALCYVVTGASGAVLHALAHRGAPVPLIGASGAIAGLAGAVVVALPNARFNRIFSPILWPATPIVALVRGRGLRALLELLPLYGWVLKLERGLPAFFVLPAWLSLDLFSMILQPAGRVSFACHVGGAFAGMGFAALMRVTKLPERMHTRHVAALAAEEAGLAPSLRARREAERPSRFPEGGRSGIWFVLSLLTAAGLMAASFRVSEVASAYRDKRENEALRKKLLESKDASAAAFDDRYEHLLFTVSFPSVFWACGKGRAATGPCEGHKSLDAPNVGSVELIHPEAHESVFVMAVKNGVDKRSELVSAVADGVTKEVADKAKWRLVETHAGTCHGEYSIESIIEIGSDDAMLRMWSCTFSKELDLYLYAYVVPEVLRARDEKLLGRILGEAKLAEATAQVTAASRGAAVSLGEALPAGSGSAAPRPPPPGGEGAQGSEGEITSCPNGQLAYHVEGKLQCYAPLGDTRPSFTPPSHTPPRSGATVRVPTPPPKPRRR
ncbi:MAG: rhomboid family intramembrane serine protease [Deltaproteobacteria bacterium]|nr:rhomboid family intramembrane serine protease [Deltaproteobacteria bacterium]